MYKQRTTKITTKLKKTEKEIKTDETTKEPVVFETINETGQDVEIFEFECLPKIGCVLL